MKVKCIANAGESLSQKTIDMDYKKDFKFSVDIGTIYNVYGMFMWGGSLDYLLSSNDGKPSWFPAELFEVIDHLSPIIWFFNFERYKNYEGSDTQRAIYGYKELVADGQHYIDLENGEPKALEIFNKRKRQIDEWQELSHGEFKRRAQW
jgi:hypothetical protein